MRELAEQVIALTGIAVEVVFAAAEDDPGSASRTSASPKLLGWQPTIALRVACSAPFIISVS